MTDDEGTLPSTAEVNLAIAAHAAAVKQSYDSIQRSSIVMNEIWKLN